MEPKLGIMHVVLFWLKNPRSVADREKLIAGIRTLAGIEVVRSLQLGGPAPTEERDVVDHTFSVSEVLTFDNVVDQHVYQEHSIHKRFVADCGHLWERVKVYDIAEFS